MKRQEFLKAFAFCTTGMMTLGGFLSVEGCSPKALNKDCLDLSGTWKFRLDPNNRGISQSWFKKEFSQTLNLPGSIQEQGVGEEVSVDTDWMVSKNYYEKMWFTNPRFERYRQPEDFAFPDWLQPEKHYIGAAWFQREVIIPQEWKNKHLVLHLERCHWKTTLWVNDKKIASDNSLATRHEYDLTDILTPGTHTISIRIDNSMIVNIGKNPHSITDHTQSAWNGIIGANELQSTPKIWIEDVQIYPDIKNKTAELHIKFGNLTAQKQKGNLRITASSFNTDSDHQVKPLQKLITITNQREHVEVLSLPMGEKVQLWDEFNPALYRLTLRLDLSEDKDKDVYQTFFGMREVKIKNQNILLNGRNIMLRGSLECCIFPKTGYPATDEESWQRICGKLKAHGLNHIRFHSWCPPKAAFVAADKAGVYIQPEVNVWTHIHTQDQYDFLMQESKKMLENYGNHPSFLMMGLGNEAFCKKEFMLELMSEWKQDDRRIYTGLANSNGSIIEEYDHVIARKINGKRIRFQSGWPPKPEGNWLLKKKPNTNSNFQKVVKSYNKPLISHEIGQRCSYPGLDQSKKYTGSFTAGYLKIAKDQLKERGMWDQWEDFIQASGRWQVELYKEEIEACLRTSNLSGFQLLQLHDFPGQSGALVGVLDAFWDEKGYCNPDFFKSFCGPTVPLAKMDQRVWTNDDVFTANIQLFHYGQADYTHLITKINIKDDEGNEVAGETKEVRDVKTGMLHDIGDIKQNLSSLKTPDRYRLTVDFEHISANNSWNFWVFPPSSGMKKPDNRNISIEHSWNDQVKAKLNKGKKILLQPNQEVIKGDLPPCFLNMYWTQFDLTGGESQGMGLLCDPSHPVFADFPTAYHTNWHWWELLSKTSPIIFDGYEHAASWPKNFRPLIQLIDGWETNRKLGVLAEARVGNSKIIICSMDLTRSLAIRPVARQFRKSLLTYMNSTEFKPEIEIEPKHLDALFR